MKIKVICDGISNITKELVEKFQVEFIPLHIIINNNEDSLETNLDIPNFLDRLVNDDTIHTIKTSQCNVDDFHTLYEKYINDYDVILHLCGSSVSSGTYQSSMIARDMMEQKEKIVIVDSQTIAIGGTWFVDRAIQLIKEEKSIEDIISTLEKEKQNLQVYFTVENLDYLKKCGRVSFPKAALANLLNLKPIMHIKDGLPYLNKQIRGKKQVTKFLVDTIREEYAGGKVYIVYGINKENACKLKEELMTFIPEENIEMTVVSCGIAVQVGPDGYGVSYLKKEN